MTTALALDRLSYVVGPSLVIATLFAACGGKVVFTPEGSGGTGQGGAGSTSSKSVSTDVSSSSSSSGSSCQLPAPMGTAQLCGGTGSGGTCLNTYCDSGNASAEYDSSCQGSQCTCTLTVNGAVTASCTCQAAGDACSGGQSCCPFVNGL